MRAKTIYAKALTPGKVLVGRRRVSICTILTYGRHQYQDLSYQCDAGGLLVLRAKGTKGIGTTLPKRCHHDNPAEPIVVYDRLAEMCNCEDPKQNRERYRCGKSRGVRPHRVACLCRNVSIDARG